MLPSLTDLVPSLDVGPISSVFRCYAETKLGSGNPRYFVIQFDPSQVVSGSAAVDNYLDLDEVAPPPPALRQPELKVRVTPAVTPDGLRTALTIDLSLFEARSIADAVVTMYVALDRADVYPRAGPDPSEMTFFYLRFLGDGAHPIPRQLRVGIERDVSTADEIVKLQLVTAEATEPLAIELGLATGPVVARAPVIQSSYTVAYQETMVAGTLRGTDTATAPTAFRIDLRVSDPSGGRLTLPLASPLALDLGAPYAPLRPAPPTATLAATGAGNVDRGAHSYKVTFGLQNANESGASDPSAPVVVANPSQDGRVRLANVPIGAPQTDARLNVTERRIYRTRAGNDGEWFLVGNLPGNTATTFIDDMADTNLGAVPLERLDATYTAPLALNVDAIAHSRAPGAADRVELYTVGLPLRIAAKLASRPAAGVPRVTFDASAVLAMARVVLPTLRRGAYAAGEILFRGVPQQLGAHWRAESPRKGVFELCGAGLGVAADPIDDLQVVLARPARSLRAAPQAVALELVERWQDATTLTDRRLRAGVRGLRRLRVATGEQSPYHSRENEGLRVALQLGDPLTGRLRARSLRLLRISNTFVQTTTQPTREHTELLGRAGELPDLIEVDTRASGDFFGLRLSGALKRVKALLMRDATSPVAADGQRIWLTLPQTPDWVDFSRDEPGLHVMSAAPFRAEVSVRDPGGIGTGADPFRHLKALLGMPAKVDLLTPRELGGTVGTGTTASKLIDPTAQFDPTLVGAQLRYRTGAQAGQRRAITAWRSAKELDCAAFPAVPGVGDQYSIDAGLRLDAPGAAPLGSGASARVSASKKVDELITVRTSPQVRVRSERSSGSPPTLRQVVARVYGIESFGLSTWDGSNEVGLALHKDRPNTSFCALLEEVADGSRRDVVKVRVMAVPEEALFFFAPALNTYEIALPRATGLGRFWAEPEKVRSPGDSAGIGLLTFDFDAIPRRVRIVVDGSAPGIWSGFPANWKSATIALDASDSMVLRWLRAAAHDRDHPSDGRVWWTLSEARLMRWDQQSLVSPPRRDRLTLWSMSEITPGDPAKPKGGLGFDIDPQLLITLDLDAYEAVTQTRNTRHDAIPVADWNPKAELQMKGYAGTVVIADPPGGVVAGSEGGGTGLWFLRAVDGRPWYVWQGSAYFGNTSAAINKRLSMPRIFK